MNRKQRDKNRSTAEWLRDKAAQPCQNCGMRARHWINWPPMTLEDIINETEPQGFWTCPKLYGEDGVRLPDA